MDNITNGATNNSMFDDVDINSMPYFKVAMTVILFAIMFGMGCAVDYLKLKENLRRPVGLIVGLLCQIILMPVAAYVIIKIFALTPAQAMALALIGVSPGGHNSNVITYLLNGDISLSVAMTTCSNILALATVPTWMLIYATIENMDEDLIIDYGSLAITLLTIAIPIGAGVYFRYKFPKRADVVPKIAAGIALVLLIIVISVMIVVVKIPFVFSGNTILPTALLPVIGVAMAYAISWIPALNIPQGSRTAIAIETGIQNPGVANSVLILSFGHKLEIYSNAVTLPLIYNIAQTVMMFLLIVGYRVWLCAKKDRRGISSPEEKNDSIKDDPAKTDLLDDKNLNA